MHVGDLVFLRPNKQSGLVVKKRSSHSGLETSEHTRLLSNNYPQVYYVFFPDTGMCGPYYFEELSLQRSYCDETDS